MIRRHDGPVSLDCLHGVHARCFSSMVESMREVCGCSCHDDDGCHDRAGVPDGSGPVLFATAD